MPKKPISQFTSKCCDANFIGVIRDKSFLICCEKCKNPIGMVVPFGINLEIKNEKIR